MRLVIEKLGQIREAALEIRPLTILAGRNNTNKTWAAYALYALAQSLSARLYHWGTYSAATADLEIPRPLAERLEAAVSGVLEKQRESKSDSTATTVYRNELLDSLELLDPIRFTLTANALSALLAVEVETVVDARVSLELDKRIFLYEGKNPSLAITLNRQPGNLLLELPAGGPFSHGMSIGTTPQYFEQQQYRANIASYVRWLTLGIEGNVVAFPSERKGLWTIANQLPPDTIAGRLTVPVADFVRFVQIANQRNSTSVYHGFHQYVDILKTRVLEGSLGYVGPPQSKELEYAAQAAPSLKLRSAASLVRSLSGLAVFLWTFAQPGDMIIIDEPEMNAHPDAQLRIMEFLALLATSGFKIVITTHSPYMTDHLNNLMEASKLSPRAQQGVKKQFKLGDARAFISPEKVAAYWFTDDGEVRSVLDQADGITEMATFGDVSDYVSNLYAELLEKKDAEAPHAV